MKNIHNYNGRAILTGITSAIELLKESCIIDLYTHAMFYQRTKADCRENIYKFRPVGKHPDLLEKIDELLKEKQHILNIHITDKNQHLLKSYIQRKYNL